MTIERLAAALADRYRIERELGQGGMATVYLAEDLKHHRKVAVKVLKPELAAVLGPDRFLKEIELTASLQHPHILPLFDSGNVGGLLFYVMPYVEGETLRSRLEREHQLPIADALRIATEVADALEYAHKRKVIHRDIKPENILLHDGRPLVADFGIALAVQQAGGSRMTQTGMSLGTPQYMAPEQAMGDKGVDARADIYALGVVTYEMLAGEPPFIGPTAQAIVAKVMTEDPRPLVPQRRSIPPHIESAVLTALEKLPADRFATAAEFAAALAASTGVRPLGAVPRRTRAVPIALVAGGLLGLAAGIATMAARGHSEVSTGDITHVTTEDGLEVQPAISPDGSMMVYAAGTSMHVRLYLRPVDGGRAVPLTSNSTAVQQMPRWSPSGHSVLFLANGGVDTVVAGLGGGSPATVINGAQGPVVTAAWSPDGDQIAFVRRDSVMIYTIASGETRSVATQWARECSWSPRGDLIACSVPRNFSAIGASMGNAGPSQITITPASGGTPVPVTDIVSLNVSPVWSPDGGRLYFVSNRHHQRDIYYVSVGGDGRPQGEARRLTTALNAAALSLSRDGRRLAYSVYIPQSNIWSVPILPSGIATSAMATQVTYGHQLIENMFVTPDGKTLFYDSDRNGNSDIWQLATGDSQPGAMSHDPADEFGPALSPDSRRLAFYSYREGSNHGLIMVRPMDGGPIEQVNSSASYGIWPEWTPDGGTLLWGCSDQGRPVTCAATRDSAGRWRVEKRPPGQQHGNWSPDGRWAADAYRVGTARDSVWIYPADSSQPRMLYARQSPADPSFSWTAWSSDSRSLYFKSNDAGGRSVFWTLSIEGGPPRVVARLDDLTRPSYRPDFATDGRRLYFAINDRQSDISVVELIER